MYTGDLSSHTCRDSWLRRKVAHGEGPCFNIYNFMCLVVAMLGLCCCTGFSLVVELLNVVASLVVEHRLWGMQSSLAVARGLRSCSSWARVQAQQLRHRGSLPSACGVFLGHRLNPVSPALNSLPLSHQGSPGPFFNKADVGGTKWSLSCISHHM